MNCLCWDTFANRTSKRASKRVFIFSFDKQKIRYFLNSASCETIEAILLTRTNAYLLRGGDELLPRKGLPFQKRKLTFINLSALFLSFFLHSLFLEQFRALCTKKSRRVIWLYKYQMGYNRCRMGCPPHSLSSTYWNPSREYSFSALGLPLSTSKPVGRWSILPFSIVARRSFEAIPCPRQFLSVHSESM